MLGEPRLFGQLSIFLTFLLNISWDSSSCLKGDTVKLKVSLARNLASFYIYVFFFDMFESVLVYKWFVYD